MPATQRGMSSEPEGVGHLNPKSFHIDLAYRGSRDYLHSASIENALAALFPDATYQEIHLREWMTHRLLFRHFGDGEAVAGKGHAIVERNGQRVRWEITEDTDYPATAREPYDEDAVPTTLDLESRRIQVGSLPGYTVFDRLVAANKVLINRVLKPGVKLIAVKITTPGFPPDDAEVSLRLVSHVGNRIFRSEIEMNGSKCGEVLFYGK